MSKATRQSACLLSAMSGCFYYLHNKKFFSRVDLKEDVQDGYDFTLQMAVIWNKGDNIKDYEYAVDILHQWSEYLSSRDEFFDAATYVYILSRMRSDLSDKINNVVKIRTLDQLGLIIDKLTLFVDPEGANFLAGEEGDRALDSLYKLIDWRW